MEGRRGLPYRTGLLSPGATDKLVCPCGAIASDRVALAIASAEGEERSDGESSPFSNVSPRPSEKHKGPALNRQTLQDQQAFRTGNSQ
jgi:hypothetical protein